MLKVENAHSGVVGVPIAQAYRELSPSAFSVWIIMHTLDDDDMVGRAVFAKNVGFSEGRMGYIIQELRLKQYVDVTPGAVKNGSGPGRSLTKFGLKKLCVLEGFDRIMKLSKPRDGLDRHCSDCPFLELAPKMPDHVNRNTGEQHWRAGHRVNQDSPTSDVKE